MCLLSTSDTYDPFVMAKIVANCHKLVEDEILRRSSQILSVVKDRAYIFGGELRPREPRDNDVHAVLLSGRNDRVILEPETAQSPSPRVGAAACSLNEKIYLFSGRGGIEMAPLEENGGIWEYDPSTANWSCISPSLDKSYPTARSYHCMASDGKDTLYVHAGCPAKGRLADLWAFSVSRKSWTELSPAFDPPRGGTSITFCGDKLYRMNGFDGKSEQGGNLDIYSPDTNSWDSHAFQPDGKQGPSPRSVSNLLSISLGGRKFLVTLFGERDPSSLGHQGAGKMLNDIWAFDIESKKWQEITTQGSEFPLARGWFDADVIGTNTIVVHGGLGELNERLGDVWTLELSVE